jgi:inner membrane protein COX18
MLSHRKKLFKENNCQLVPTMLFPQLVNLPLFVAGSFICSAACMPPSPLSMESILTLHNLSAADSTATLPIIVGLITFANVETSRWLVGGQHARELLARKLEQKKKDEEEGIIRINPQDASKSMLRLFSVLRIVVGLTMPGVGSLLCCKHLPGLI